MQEERCNTSVGHFEPVSSDGGDRPFNFTARFPQIVFELFLIEVGPPYFWTNRKTITRRIYSIRDSVDEQPSEIRRHYFTPLESNDTALTHKPLPRPASIDRSRVIRRRWQRHKIASSPDDHPAPDADYIWPRCSRCIREANYLHSERRHYSLAPPPASSDLAFISPTITSRAATIIRPGNSACRVPALPRPAKARPYTFGP